MHFWILLYVYVYKYVYIFIYIYIHVYRYIYLYNVLIWYVSYLDDYFGLMVSIHSETERSMWYVKWVKWYAKETHVRCKRDLCDVYTFWTWWAKETYMIPKRNVCDTEQLNMMCYRNLYDMCKRLVWYANNPTCSFRKTGRIRQRKPCTHVPMYPCTHVPMYPCSHAAMYLLEIIIDFPIGFPINNIISL